MSNETTGLSYRDAGVDVEAAADAFVDRIAAHTKSTHNAVDVLKKTAMRGWFVHQSMAKSPLIAATCDGVGTKLLVARQVGWFEGAGTRSVALNVNDSSSRSSATSLFSITLCWKARPQRDEQIVAGRLRVVRIDMCTHRW